MMEYIRGQDTHLEYFPQRKTPSCGGMVRGEKLSAALCPGRRMRNGGFHVVSGRVNRTVTKL